MLVEFSDLTGPFVGIQQHVLTGAVAEAQAVLLEQLDVPARTGTHR